MAKHSVEFKLDAVAYHDALRHKGNVLIRGKEINSVRELVKELGITNTSLYSWTKLYLESEANEIKDIEKELPREIIRSFSEWELDNAFWMCIARNLGIKSYRMPQKLLLDAIGKELIKRSELL